MILTGDIRKQASQEFVQGPLYDKALCVKALCRECRSTQVRSASSCWFRLSHAGRNVKCGGLSVVTAVEFPLSNFYSCLSAYN